MRRFYSLAAAALVLGCTDDASNTTAPQLSPAVVGATSTKGASADKDDNNGNHIGQRLDIVLLTGAEEVPPRVTGASGQLTLQLSKDGQSMDYILDIANISNVTQAHIHVAPKGSNGGIAIWLYPSVKSRTALPGGGGPVSRLLIEGTFTAADFVANSALAGKTMADFVALVNAAGAYGNVHTNDGVGDTNTGPGDFPGGEIRGQLDGHSKH
jgi:hypothetical protein